MPNHTLEEKTTTAGPTRLDLESVTVIIPALNEAESLPSVLNDLPEVGQVIVVDNGSTDGTSAVARRFGAFVVCEGRRGYGSACWAGLEAIRRAVEAGRAQPKVVVFLDGDYSDHPDLLPQLVQPIFEGRADFVLGSRLLGHRERERCRRRACWATEWPAC